MKKRGWQQPPRANCTHMGASFASVFAASIHEDGDEWICSCGKVFIVVSDKGRNKKLVERTP